LRFSVAYAAVVAGCVPEVVAEQQRVALVELPHYTDVDVGATDTV
jgi:hypothetical protein